VADSEDIHLAVDSGSAAARLENDPMIPATDL
jgi:hypothetical protein